MESKFKIGDAVRIVGLHNYYIYAEFYDFYDCINECVEYIGDDPRSAEVPFLTSGVVVRNLQNNLFAVLIPDYGILIFHKKELELLYDSNE